MNRGRTFALSSMDLSSDKYIDPLARHSVSPGELQALLAAERTGEPFFAFRDAQQQLVIFAMGTDDATRTIGRRPEVDLSISWDAEVSGLHAEMQGFSGEWTIADDGLSSNGTYVNGHRISGRQRLRDGDRLRVGRTILAYHAAPTAVVTETAIAVERLAPPELTQTQRRVLIALCRPYRDGNRFATPATNQQIADELFLSVDAVKMHLRGCSASSSWPTCRRTRSARGSPSPSCSSA
jgi:FHA domain